jgi:hypothetical protein
MKGILENERIRSLFFVAVISLAGMSCGADTSEDEDQTQEEGQNSDNGGDSSGAGLGTTLASIDEFDSGVSSNGEATTYEGTWQTDCVNESVFGYNSKVKIHVFDGNTMLLKNINYAEADCAGDIVFQDVKSFSFELSARDSGEGENIDYSAAKYAAVYNTEEAVDMANTFQVGGVTNWAQSVAQEFTVDVMEYSIVNVNADDELCVGYFDMMGDGDTEATRHQTYTFDCMIKQ